MGVTTRYVASISVGIAFLIRIEPEGLADPVWLGNLSLRRSSVDQSEPAILAIGSVLPVSRRTPRA